MNTAFAAKKATVTTGMSDDAIDGVLMDIAGEAEQANAKPRSPAELRDNFNNLLNTNSEIGDKYSSTMTVLDIGETKSIILGAVATMGKFSTAAGGESFMSRLTSRIPGLGALAKKLEKDIKETIVEGKTIKQVSNELITTLNNKRQHTVEAAASLEDLVVQWEDNFEYLRQIAFETQAAYETCEPRDRLAYSALLNEIMSTLDHIKENIETAMGTIKAASLATEQVAGLVPKLRAVLQDSMIIRKTLNDLEELGQMTTMLDETTSLIRDDNFGKMKESVMNVLERSVISNDKVKRLENSSRRTTEFANDVRKKLTEVSTRQMAVADRLGGNILSLGNDAKNDILALSHRKGSESEA
jgi:uracil phosphoribosyltransferase